MFRLKTQLKKVLSKFSSNDQDTFIDKIVGRRQRGCSDEQLTKTTKSCKRKAQSKSSKSSKPNCKAKLAADKKTCIEGELAVQPGDQAQTRDVKNRMAEILTDQPEEGFQFMRELKTNLQSGGVCVLNTDTHSNRHGIFLQNSFGGLFRKDRYGKMGEK